MNLGWFLTNAAAALLLPPLSLILLAGAGILLRRRWPRMGPALALSALAVLTALSTNAGARLLVRPLEDMTPALDLSGAIDAEAIVVLGGGRKRNAPEYGQHDVPRAEVLGRLRYGARLHWQTGLPLLVAGGSPEGAEESEARMMAQVLREDFGVPVRWLEEGSDNTAQNAGYAAVLLRRDGVKRVLLVTDALHMPRASRIFSQAGLHVLPAPTNYLSRGSLQAIDVVPDAGALRDARYALHEWIGMLWYRLAHREVRSLLPPADRLTGQQ
jgi:uncharacterized SAM-binding protein YcdF (DUF218 family)